MHFDREFQIVLRGFGVVFGGLWLLAPQVPFQHLKKVDQRTAAANSTCIMRAVAEKRREGRAASAISSVVHVPQEPRSCDAYHVKPFAECLALSP